MLGKGAFERTLLGDAAPDAGALRRPGEAFDERGEDAVAGRGGDGPVELDVGADEMVDPGLGGGAVEDLAELGESLVVDADRGAGACGRFEDAPHLEQL